MQYYPVIYTRTRCCDYFAGFHVRPDFIVPAEVLPYIRTATTDMDAYEHTKKHLIISTDKMILFGIVGFIQDIGGTAVELYARDEKNRAIFGFYGFAAKRENDFNTSKIPDIQDCDIIRAYEKYVMPYWNCLDQDTKKAEPISLEEKEIAVSPIPEEFLWNETVHVHSETDNPDRLYTTLLLDALNGTVLSYCSCVNDFKALKNSRFSHVVTNKNNRFRLKKEQEERLEQERQEREKKHSKKKDNDCTIEADSSYGTQKKNKDTSENYPGINSDLDSNLSNYHDWKDVLEESEYEQLKKETAGKIQEALQEKASKSNKFGRFMKQYWRIIGAICISVMIPIMIGLIKKYTTTKSTSEEGETEDAE
ncbi:hypothetical protein [uncultured Ruminococcus sp.]|jgi:hypothetical protein|uniref:hypothetical protein n=1 Tax=uncultured Ruminococcus sp. TaxID=165186 RepID=UPI002670146E|nr:hypothetical protein [uncultured Ruminococcus sp.]